MSVNKIIALGLFVIAFIAVYLLDLGSLTLAIVFGAHYVGTCLLDMDRKQKHE